MEEKKMNQDANNTEPTGTAAEKVKETLAAGKEALTAGAGKLKEKADELKVKAQQAKAQQAQGENAGTDGTTSPAPKKNKKFLLVGAAVLALILLVTIMSGGRTKVDMKDYITVTFTGLDSKGTASMTVDYNALAKVANITSNKKSNSELSNMIYMLGEEWVKFELLNEGIECTLENAKELSNGDKVTVKVTADDDVCKQLNIKVKNQTLTFKVEGLTKVTNFDAFADIEVRFDGISPQGTATLINNSRDEACMSYTYSLDVNSGLSNGDTVTVTISENVIDRMAEQTGKAPEVLSKQFTVSGLSTYVTELSQISDEAMKSMQKEAEDSINAYVANNWTNGYLEGLKYLGNYLLVRKPHASTDRENALFLVYEISYGNNYNDGDYHTTYYYYVRYRNLYNDGDNQTVVNLSDRGTPNSSVAFDVSGSYSWNRPTAPGYATLPDLYKACVTSNIDNYTYESSVS